MKKQNLTTLTMAGLFALLSNCASAQEKQQLVSKIMPDWEENFYSYTPDGKIDSAYCWEVTDQIYETYEKYFYDEKGNCIRRDLFQNFDEGWRKTSYLEYSYDERNLVVQRLNYNNFGSEEFSLSGKLTYTYDEAGNLLEINTYMPSWETEGEFDLYSTELYGYENGRLTTRYIIETSFLTNELDTSGRYEYIYDESGKLIEYKVFVIDIYSDGSESLSSRQTYTYDGSGNVEDITTWAGGNPYIRQIYRYDSELLASNTFLPFNFEEESALFAMRNSPNLILSEEYWQVPVEVDTLTLVGIYEYTYEPLSSSNIAKEKTEDLRAIPFVHNQILFLENIQDGTPVQIFDMKGRLLLDTRYDTGGISISGLAQGAYIARINHGRDAVKFIQAR